eukprot:s2383_g9.t1
MVDRTVYTPDKTPDLPLRQVLGRQRVAEDLCKTVADAGLRSIETFSMLGDNIATVKQTLRAIIPDAAKFGATAPEQELALTALGLEPHRKFVERVQRDHMVHGFVHFYEVGEIRTRNEQIAQKSGLSKNAEDLLRVVMIDQPTSASSETQVMDKLHAFFITLEYLNICEFSFAAGPLKYLAELEEWRHENRGLALLLAADALIRKKVHRVSSDQRKKFGTFSAALLEVLTNHKQLWNDARSSAELDKFKQASSAPAPVTPSRKRSRSPSRSATKISPKAKKNKARRARQKAQLQRARELTASTPTKLKETTKKPSRDDRVPAKEWQQITSFKYSGPKRCPFFNCSLGCRFGDQCRQKHACVSPGSGPPGNWDSPAQECNDGSASLLAPQRSAGSAPVPVEAWSTLPADPTVLRDQGPFFLEIFSGTAGLTEAVQLMGIPVLPPVDVVPSALVVEPTDVLDLAAWHKILRVVAFGLVFYVHCGTPCNTFTAARKDDGGPPPLRSREHPMGLGNLSELNRNLVLLGNIFLDRTVEICFLVFVFGGDFSIENPLLSLLWETFLIQQLVADTRALALDFDQCAFGAPSKKPTRLLCSTELMDVVCLHCPGDHQHEVLTGKLFDPSTGRWVYKTKAAQVYPWSLCASMAAAIFSMWRDPFGHLQASFRLTTPGADRKRALGSSKPWKGHRQAGTALKAQAAGYQLKRGAAKPLLEVEMEPGQAIQAALQIVHPFSMAVQLDVAEERALLSLSRPADVIVAEREQLLHFWHQRALALLPVSVQMIQQQPDPALRRLLLGDCDAQQPVLGQVCHIALYAEMLQACNSVDQQLPQLLLNGFPIVGEIQRTNRWPAYDKVQKDIPVQEALRRAWVIRKKIIQRVASVPVTDNLKKIWEASLEDVHEGSCLGPFKCEEEITAFLKCDDWIPTQRFEVVQKNKVRGCDSATTNMINQVTKITEKLQLPSTDTNVAALRRLRSIKPDEGLAGWVLDERKAYRQVAVRPDHRKFSVICLKDPCSGLPNFFIMVGHSFGLVSAVYNYNRRSAAINEVLVSLFGLIAFSFYDDKYGFEPHSRDSRCPTILGVTYNLEAMQLEIKPDRKVELNQEIDAILSTKLLDPGTAGKLKGKLMFGSSQLWGKVGRAFLRVISERQYLRFPLGHEFALDPPLTAALLHWKMLISDGPPRPIETVHEKLTDVVIFTDGFTPDPRSREDLPDRVGGVLVDRRLLAPRQFTAVVPESIKKRWLGRSTQIIPVELIESEEPT